MTEQITDWRIDLNGGEAIVFPGARLPPDSEIAAEGARLTEWLREHASDRPQFGVVIGSDRYRAQALASGVFILRKIRRSPFSLDELGLHSAVINALMDRSLEEGGLILIAGPTGAGKTSTLVAALLERNRRHGGYCLAIEDPSEYVIAGPNGDSGYIDQIEADGPEDYCKRAMRAVRCFPAKTRGTLFLGEIRDQVTALEAVRAALAGFIVFATIHAFSPISTIQRMFALMGGESDEALRSLLSDALRLLVYQQWLGGHGAPHPWLPTPAVAGAPAALALSAVSDKVKSAIKHNKLDVLKDDLNTIKNQMNRR